MKVEKVDKMNKYPKYEEIVNAYNELLEIVKDAKTVSDLIEIKKQNHLTFEIDGYLIETQLEENYITLDTELSTIEWFRVEGYKMLDYIYFRTDKTVYFDVWSDYYDNDFIDSMTIENFTEEKYKKEIESFEIAMKNFKN